MIKHVATLRRDLQEFVPSERYYGPDGSLRALDRLEAEFEETIAERDEWHRAAERAAANHVRAAEERDELRLVAGENAMAALRLREEIEGSAHPQTLEELLEAGMIESALLLRAGFTPHELELIRKAYEIGCQQGKVIGASGDEAIVGIALQQLIGRAHQRGVEDAKAAAAPKMGADELMEQLRDEYEALGLMSYHGATDAVPTIWMADIGKDGVERLRELLREAGARLMLLDQMAYEAAKREMAARAILSDAGITLPADADA